MPFFKVINGDCIEEMKKLPTGIYDAIVCDPPYALTSDKLRVGFEYCLRRSFFEVLLPNFDDLEAKRFQRLNLRAVLPNVVGLRGAKRAGVEARVSVPVGTVDFKDRVVVRQEEVNDESVTSSRITKDSLPLVSNPKAVEFPGHFILQLRDTGNLSFCKSACGCFRKLGAGRFTVPVVVSGLSDLPSLLGPGSPSSTSLVADRVGSRHNALSGSGGPTRVVAGSGAEFSAMLTLDVARGTCELLPADSAGTAHFVLKFIRPESVRAVPRAGSFPTELEPAEVSSVTRTADGTISINGSLFTHANVLSFLRGSVRGKGFMGNDWDVEDVAFSEALWAEAFRVLKPGGFLLAFGGARTFHRLAAAIEDAGFRIYDQIDWIYAKSFPKNRNIAADIDKLMGVTEWKETTPNPAARECNKDEAHVGLGGWTTPPRPPKPVLETDEAKKWKGWGTALKTTHEPVCVAQKPISEKTIARNVLKWGTGVLNIDGCRIATNDDLNGGAYAKSSEGPGGTWREFGGETSMKNGGAGEFVQPDGRWPTNNLFSHNPSCKQVGSATVKARVINRYEDGAKPFGGGAGHEFSTVQTSETGSEDIPVFECTEGCPVRALDQQSGTLTSGKPGVRRNPHETTSMAGRLGMNGQQVGYADSGGASRFYPCFEWDDLYDVPFFYNTKAAGAEKKYGEISNDHPTVKPVRVANWLIKLVCRPGATILDPFAGSGSMGVAAMLYGVNYIGIEMQEKFVELANKRIQFALDNETETRKATKMKGE